jgi:hypothetical protein
MQVADNFVFVGSGMGVYDLQSVSLANLFQLPIKMDFPVTSQTTLGDFKRAVVDSHIFNAVLFKYSVSA